MTLPSLAASPTPAPGRYVVLLWMASLAVLTYVDRLCISVAGPRIQQELQLSPQQWGWVAGVFAISYGALEMPLGAWGDRHGRRDTITRIVLWWSLFTSLTGMVQSLGALLWVRFLFGAGEAGAFPNIAGVLSVWFPLAERARAQGAIWASSRIGGILAPLLLVPLMSLFGWRIPFGILGALGIAWVLLWRPGFREFPQRPPQQIPHLPVRHLLSSGSLRLLLAMYCCYGCGSYFYLSWLHTYLVKGRGFSESQMALVAALPFAVGASANLVGGWMGDHLVRRFDLRNGRRLLGAASLAMGSLLVALTAWTESSLAAVLFVSLGYGCLDLMLPSAWSICLDLGGRHAGAVSGAMNSFGHIGGFATSVVFGYLVAATDNYNAPLYFIAGALLIAALLFSRIDASRPIAAPGLAEDPP